jgi:hypothetical protein
MISLNYTSGEEMAKRYDASMDEGRKRVIGIMAAIQQSSRTHHEAILGIVSCRIGA